MPLIPLLVKLTIRAPSNTILHLDVPTVTPLVPLRNAPSGCEEHVFTVAARAITMLPKRAMRPLVIALLRLGGGAVVSCF